MSIVVAVFDDDVYKVVPIDLTTEQYDGMTASDCEDIFDAYRVLVGYAPEVPTVEIEYFIPAKQAL
jgi:hypothetical protein